MDISTLSSGTAATMAQTTASMVDTQAAQTSRPETHLSVLPSRDTVQISAEARSLSTQMTPVATATSELSSRSNSTDNPTQKSTSALRLVSREDSSSVEGTTASLENVAGTEKGRVGVEQEPSSLQKAEKKSEEKQRTSEDENKSQSQLREVETEIGRANRDITFLVGRATINESAREQLHEKKSELSVLMVELLQLESVSTNSLR